MGVHGISWVAVEHNGIGRSSHGKSLDFLASVAFRPLCLDSAESSEQKPKMEHGSRLRTRLRFSFVLTSRHKKPARALAGGTMRNGATRAEKQQMACKPGSVSGPVSRPGPRAWGDAGRRMAIPLGRRLPVASRDQPGRQAETPVGPWLPMDRPAPIRSCSRWGLPCHDRCRPRGALLPHPFTLTRPEPGGLLSVALSLGSPPPGVTRHRVSVEPGLSSPPGRSPAERPSGHLLACV
jgi:hypothetical protein